MIATRGEAPISEAFWATILFGVCEEKVQWPGKMRLPRRVWFAESARINFAIFIFPVIYLSRCGVCLTVIQNRGFGLIIQRNVNSSQSFGEADGVLRQDFGEFGNIDLAAH